MYTITTAFISTYPPSGIASKLSLQNNNPPAKMATSEAALRLIASSLFYTPIHAAPFYEKATKLQSPLFVSIDTGFNDNCITQLGISTFDPTSLLLPIDESRDNNESAIKTAWYARSTKLCRKLNRRQKPFRFGERQDLSDNDVQSLLEQVLMTEDEHGTLRDVILVGHSIMCDISVIHKFHGFIRSLPAVKAILDTQQVCLSIMDASTPISLKQLLNTLCLEHIGLHNAAHDSRYTLQALLAISCRYERSCNGPLSLEMTDRLNRVEWIARHHKPGEPILWCDESKRVKFTGNPDLLDVEHIGSPISLLMERTEQ